MIRFNVAQLLKSEPGAVREYDLDEDISGIDEELEVTKPLTGKVRLLRSDDGILVTGHIKTEVRVPCVRCLTLFTVPIEIDVEESFRPSIDILTGAPIPAADGEDEVTRLDGHHILDLTEVIRQDLLLAIPMSTLCHPDCRGICPGCGANLNEEPCTCQPEEGDPRLAVLRELL
jgi:uncharacterized protein